MSSNFANKFEKLKEFRIILYNFTKNIIHDHPKDILEYSIQYFKFLENDQKKSESFYDETPDESKKHKNIESLKTLADEKDVGKNDSQKIPPNKCMFLKFLNNDDEPLIPNDGVYFSEEVSANNDDDSEGFIKFFDNRINYENTKEIEKQIEIRKNIRQRTRAKIQKERETNNSNEDDLFEGDENAHY